MHRPATGIPDISLTASDISHGSAGRRFLAGMARYAALYFSAKNIRPAGLAMLRGAGEPGDLHILMARYAALYFGCEGPHARGPAISAKAAPEGPK